MLTLHRIGHWPPLPTSPYPKRWPKKKAILNVKNRDEKCLIWSILAHKLNLHWDEHAERVSHYQHLESTLNMESVTYPVHVDKIPVVER